jgi:hypothetical protein
MIRRAYILGILAAGLAVAAADTSPLYGKLAASARKFQQSFEDLGGSGNVLSPLERFVFSLVLANGESTQTRCGAGTPHLPG